MGQLDGKIAFITGGARGQGRSHALALASEGCDISIFDVAAQVDGVPYPMAEIADLEKTAAEVAERGRRCVVSRGDVRSTADVAGALQRTVDELGGLDIVVANAGVIEYSTVETCSDSAWSTVLDTNLTGVFKTLRGAIPFLKQRSGGRIVTISSMAGRQAFPNLPHYVAAKWGIIGLTKAVAQELAGTSITANVICPATVATGLFLNEPTVQLFFPDNPSAAIDDLQGLPSELTAYSILQPEDVTRALIYLVCDPGVLTGQVMEVGNGMTARLT